MTPVTPVRSFPIILTMHVIVLSCLVTLASLHCFQGMFHHRTCLMDESSNLRGAAITCLQRADRLRDCGEYSNALTWYDRAMSLLNRIDGPHSRLMGYALHSQACCYGFNKDYKKAEELLTKTINLETDNYGANSSETILAWMNLAFAYDHDGQYNRAEFILNRYKPLLEQRQDINLICCLGNLGEVYRHEGKYAKAEPLIVRALTLAEAKQSPNSRSVAYKLDSLAQLYEAQGRIKASELLYKQALDKSILRDGAEHPQTIEFRTHYANLLRRTHRAAKATQLEHPANVD